MEKWQLEGMLHCTAHKKLILPEAGRTTPFRHSGPWQIREEAKVKIWCRRIVALFIRLF